MDTKTKAIIAFVPVIHKGYVDFFNSNEGDIYVMDRALIDSYVHLTRDLRVIEPKDIVEALKVLLPKRNIQTLGVEGITHLVKAGASFVLPEDEISHDIVEKNIQGAPVEYKSAFLRWNKFISLAEHVIPEGRKITKDAFHREMITLAEADAQKSADWWRQIATVVWKDGKVLSVHHNHHLPTDFHLSTFGDPRSNFNAGEHQDIFLSIHSEASAVADAAKQGVSLDGASMYVTTFPCPNCARLLSKAGVKKVYYSKGYSLLDASKILDHFGVEMVLVQ